LRNTLDNEPSYFKLSQTHNDMLNRLVSINHLILGTDKLPAKNTQLQSREKDPSKVTTSAGINTFSCVC